MKTSPCASYNFTVSFKPKSSDKRKEKSNRKTLCARLDDDDGTGDHEHFDFDVL